MGGQPDLVADPAAELLRVQPSRGDQLGLLARPRVRANATISVCCAAANAARSCSSTAIRSTRAAAADRRVVDWGIGEFPEAGEDRGQLGGDRVTRLDLGVRTHVRKIARPPDTLGPAKHDPSTPAR